MQTWIHPAAANARSAIVPVLTLALFSFSTTTVQRKLSQTMILQYCVLVLRVEFRFRPPRGYSNSARKAFARMYEPSRRPTLAVETVRRPETYAEHMAPCIRRSQVAGRRSHVAGSVDSQPVFLNA